MRNSRLLGRFSLGLFAISSLLTLLAITSTTGSIKAADRSRYALRSLTCGAAATSARGASFDARGTLGQPQAIGISGESEGLAYLGFWKGSTLVPTGIFAAPEQFAAKLHQNYPNPFNPATIIRYSVARAGLVEIDIFNVAGQRIRNLASGFKSPGNYTVTWDGLSEGGTKAASGIYFCRLRTGSFVETRKMVLVR